MTQPAVLPDIVHITMPDGAQATVPKEDLGQAVAAGAHLQTDAEASPLGGLGGKALTALFGAGRSATLGASDLIASEGMGLIGGEQARKDTLRGMGALKEANPYSDAAGQLGGLFLGGGGLMSAGAKAEGAATGLLGEGLLGKMAGLGARGTVEGAGIGAQQRFSEDVLGDHEFNGQAIFDSAVKDGLLGGIGGAALGGASHVFGRAKGLFSGKAAGLLKGTRGPVSDAVLDEVAGGGSANAAAHGETYVDGEGVRRYAASDGVVLEDPLTGIGRKARGDARAAEGLVDDLRKGGATTDQATAAAGAVDSAATAAGEHAASGPLTGAVDSVADAYAGAFKGKGDVLAKGYATRAARVAEGADTLNTSAAEMAKSGTRVLRNLEDTANEVQFTQKSGQFAKLVDSSKANVQRDAVASLLQDADESLKVWEGLEAKGGAADSIKSLRKTWNDALQSLSKVENDASPTMARDLYIKTDKFKRAIDRTAKWGRENRFGLPEAIIDSESGLEPLANKFRSALESEDVWGPAGPAQARWNGAFSELKARRDHFMDQLGVSIDQRTGIRIPEVDFAKTRGMLNQLTGGETDAMLQQVKSTEAVIDGMRNRAAAIREFGDLSPAQSAKLNQGLADLANFEKTFAASRKEAGIVNRLKRQQDSEQGHGVGGLLGLITDVVTRPVTTMERLAGVRHTVGSVTNGIASGFRRVFGGGGGEAAAAAPIRSKAAVAKEIGDIRELAGNQGALEAKAQAMVGDLSDHAPKTADEVKMTAKRAIMYLAKEAPIGGVSIGILGTRNTEPRYSDTQLSEWESKRNAVLGAGAQKASEVVIADMQQGRLNREAIKAIEFVSPKLFAHMQMAADEELKRLEQQGLLDKMPYQQKAAIATILKRPADGTWRPDFLAMMQATKAPPPPPAQAGTPSGPQGFGRKADKPTADMWMTEASTIEGGGMI